MRALAWTDGTRSFEKATGRKFATGKRKTQTLEEQRRAKFAAKDAQGGLQGNDNSELARAMRAWISSRDEEKRTIKEKEEDIKALDVRRDRLHGLESERLGLTDVCRYETTVVGEEGKMRTQGGDTSERTLADGDRSNPISLEDVVDDQPQQSRPDNSPFLDLDGTDPSHKAGNSDPLTPILELLRKRQ